MTRGRLSRLAHLGIEADIGDELLRAWEATDVADHRHERGGGDEAHPGHGHQPPDLLRAERLPRELSLDQADLRVEEVDLAQAAIHRLALVGWQLERRKPLPSR